MKFLSGRKVERNCRKNLRMKLKWKMILKSRKTTVNQTLWCLANAIAYPRVRQSTMTLKYRRRAWITNNIWRLPFMKTNFMKRSKKNSFNFPSNFHFVLRHEHAFITILIKEEQFIESKRSELYGWTNFLSNCGGLKIKLKEIVIQCYFNFQDFSAC